jgi:RNA polymerase sigma-70 factor, ECF subfamily
MHATRGFGVHARQDTRALASEQEMADFLASVERRAYKHALFALRDSHAALDIVQDAMLKVVTRYASRPAAELPLVFQRILQNTVRDHFRRQKVRNTWTTLLSSLTPAGEPDADPLDYLSGGEDVKRPVDPQEEVRQAETMRIIEQAIERLPARQREAFLLRYWEDMDVAETASAMGCSEGSVKTHCSRATHAIAEFLKLRGITP